MKIAKFLLFFFKSKEGKKVLVGYALVLTCCILLALFSIFFSDKPIMAIIAGMLMIPGLGLLFITDFGEHVFLAYKVSLEQKQEPAQCRSLVPIKEWQRYSPVMNPTMSN